MDHHDDLYVQLVSYIKRKFSNIPDISLLASDIVNQGYEKWIRIGKCTEENENFGYLSVICSRIALDIIKKERVKKNYFSELSYEHLENLMGESGVDEQLLQNERSNLLNNLLKSLSEAEQIVIRLRYYDELTFSEISKHTGKNLNTVLSHHRRALHKLRIQYVTYFQQEEKVNYKSTAEINNSVFLKYFQE